MFLRVYRLHNYLIQAIISGLVSGNQGLADMLYVALLVVKHEVRHFY